MTRILTLTLLLISALRVSAQSEISYVMPPDFISEDVRVNVSDILAQETLYKFKLTIENLSRTKYMAYEINKTCFEIPNAGKYYPNGRKKLVIIAPGTKEYFTVSVKSGQPLPSPRFVLTLEGLSEGIPNPDFYAVANCPLKQAEIKVHQSGSLKIDITKSDFKKDVYGIQSELSLNSKTAAVTELMLFDPNAVKAGSASLVVNDTKQIVVTPDEPEKFKFSVSSADPSIDLDWSKAFTLIPLQGVDIPAFNINNGVVPVTPVEVKVCEAQADKSQGDIQIKITSQVGCFRVFMLGEEMTTAFTSSFTFRMNESVKKVRLVMENGYVVEKSIYAKVDYKALYYEVEEKKGEYDLKYLVFASELADGVTPGVDGAQDQVKCDDQITTLEFNFISKVTVQEITKTHVMYKDCGSENIKSIAKMDILAVEYSDDSYDKFDYDGGSKQGMDITRSRKEVIQKHLESTKGTNPQNQSSFIIGP